MTLQQHLRKARQEGNSQEIKRIKQLLNIKTRNMENVTVYNKRNNILSVKQKVLEIVPINEQKETIETEVYI